MYFTNNKIDNNILKCEIDFLKYDNEKDTITLDLKEKIKSGVKKYKNLKKRINKTFGNKNKKN